MTRNHRAKKPVIRYTLEWSVMPKIEHAILSSEFKVGDQRFGIQSMIYQAHFDIPGVKQETEQEMREVIIKHFVRNKANVILVGPIEGTNGKLQ